MAWKPTTVVWWHYPKNWMDNHLPDPLKSSRRVGETKLSGMWWITPLMRWKSSLGYEFGGYELGQISRGIQPVNSSLTKRKNLSYSWPLGLYFPPKVRWNLFRFWGHTGWKLHLKRLLSPYFPHLNSWNTGWFSYHRGPKVKMLWSSLVMNIGAREY
jgi:hypothetical protein